MTNDYLQIRSSGSSSGDILTVGSSGFVGIGTTKPQSIFVVNDASGNGGTLVKLTTASTGNTGGYLELTAGPRTVRFGTDAYIGPHFGSTTTGGFMFLDNNSVSPMVALSPADNSLDIGTTTYRFRDLQFMTGTFGTRLGVGATSALFAFNVSGSMNLTGTIFAAGTTGTGTRFMSKPMERHFW